MYFIGDVHGDLGMLLFALRETGYTHTTVNGEGGVANTDAAKRAQKREKNAPGTGPRIFFTGDIIDRGGQDYECLKKVGKLVQSGLARVTMGNHEELNLALKFRDAWEGLGVRGDAAASTRARVSALVELDDQVGWSTWPTMGHVAVLPNGERYSVYAVHISSTVLYTYTRHPLSLSLSLSLSHSHPHDMRTR